MKAYQKNEIDELISTRFKAWSSDGSQLSRTFIFKNFVNAFSFMTAVAIEAEKLDHHPEWSNVYNRVTIKLNTHDAGGITSLDFDLAQKIDKLQDENFK